MRRLLYIFTTMVCIGCVCGCGHIEGEHNDDDSTALHIAVMPTMDCLPFYYADSMGLFDSLGMNVKLITYDAAMDADTAWRHGHVQGLVSDVVKQCIWQANGDSLTSVMACDMNMWLITATSARIQKETSLKDKIVAISRNSAEDFFADKIMESVKMQSTDLNKPQINKLSLRTLMVDQNQYDGALLPEPYASEAVARGAKRLTSTTALKLPAMMTVLFADSIVKARKDEVEGIVEAYNMAVERICADTVSNMLQFIPKEHCVYLPDTLYTPIIYRKATHTNDSLMQVVKAWAKNRGLIKK